jgi:hypothetical protein
VNPQSCNKRRLRNRCQHQRVSRKGPSPQDRRGSTSARLRERTGDSYLVRLLSEVGYFQSASTRSSTGNEQPYHLDENMAVLRGPLPDKDMRSRMVGHLEIVLGFDKPAQMPCCPSRQFDGVISHARQVLKRRGLYTHEAKVIGHEVNFLWRTKRALNGLGFLERKI